VIKCFFIYCLITWIVLFSTPEGYGEKLAVGGTSDKALFVLLGIGSLLIPIMLAVGALLL